jgi:hypothetical protein
MPDLLSLQLLSGHDTTLRPAGYISREKSIHIPTPRTYVLCMYGKTKVNAARVHDSSQTLVISKAVVPPLAGKHIKVSSWSESPELSALTMESCDAGF